MSEVDVEAGEPMTRTVTKIVRLKAPDYSTPRRERKEYLVYYENWYGKNWQGVKIPPVTNHVEGLYYEQDNEPIIERNKKVGIKRSGQHPVYYIPFSKEKVDEIISNSIGTDKETIIFTVISGPFSYEFPYDKFVNLSFDELNQLLIRPGGPALVIANEAAILLMLILLQLHNKPITTTVIIANNNKINK